jgi:MEDS: MEthanogen/methylotroph, DcmR Sensory domain
MFCDDQAKLPHFTRCELLGLDRAPVGSMLGIFIASPSGSSQRLCRIVWRGCALMSAASGLPRRRCRRAKPVHALRAPRTPALNDAVESAALCILDFDDWYGSSGRLKGVDLIQLWLEEEERALAGGYSGLRITGTTSFLSPGDWSTFMGYERAASALQRPAHPRALQLRAGSAMISR